MNSSAAVACRPTVSRPVVPAATAWIASSAPFAPARSDRARSRSIAIDYRSRPESVFPFGALRWDRGHLITTTAPTTTTAPGATLFAGSSRFAWHQTASSTDGVCAVAEIHVRPGGEPPLHVHGGEDELYLVLDGEITFSRGGELIDAGPGTSVFLPRGVEHGFVVRSEQARVVVVLTPGGLERAFERLSTPTGRDDAAVPAGPPSDAEVGALVATFAEYGVTFTGPPLAALLAAAPRA